MDAHPAVAVARQAVIVAAAAWKDEKVKNVGAGLLYFDDRECIDDLQIALDHYARLVALEAVGKMRCQLELLHHGDPAGDSPNCEEAYFAKPERWCRVCTSKAELNWRRGGRREPL